MFSVYLKFTFNWVSCILSVNPNIKNIYTSDISDINELEDLARPIFSKTVAWDIHNVKNFKIWVRKSRLKGANGSEHQLLKVLKLV